MIRFQACHAFHENRTEPAAPRKQILEQRVPGFAVHADELPVPDCSQTGASHVQADEMWCEQDDLFPACQRLVQQMLIAQGDKSFDSPSWRKPGYTEAHHGKTGQAKMLFHEMIAILCAHFRKAELDIALGKAAVGGREPGHERTRVRCPGPRARVKASSS